MTFRTGTFDTLPDDVLADVPALTMAPEAPAAPELRARWKKLRSGAWGLHVHGRAMSGDEVIVVKANGEEQRATVDVVLWTGADTRSGAIVSICSAMPLRRVANG